VGCQKGPSNPSSASSASSSPPASQPSIVNQTVKTEGVGKSFDEALQNALLLAIEQVNGVRASKTVDTHSLVSDFHSQDSSTGNFNASATDSAHGDANINLQATGSNGAGSLHANGTENSNDNAHASGNYASTDSETASFNSSTAIVNANSSVSGVVRRFQVASKSVSDGVWHVAIVAEIPVYQASAASKRLKIAVLPFHLSSQAGGQFEEGLRSQVIDALTQSGKVAILDRDYTQENQDEISQLQSEAFSKDEAAKLGNRLGADYILVGTVAKANQSRDSAYIASIGQTIYGASHASAGLNFRLIEAATGVVQLSGTLDSSKYPSSSLDNVAKAESADLSNRVLDSLFPLRVESVADGVFYLGRGGDGMHVGDTFRLIRQGNPITDTDTHEIIGYSEQDLGRISVTEVEPRLSKATLVSGTLSQIGDAHGLVARRTDTAATTGPTMSSGAAAVQKGPAQAKLAHKRSSDEGTGSVKEGVDF
jgi:hypothetical protein